MIGQVLVYHFDIKNKTEIIFFWIVAPIIYLALSFINTYYFGPLTHSLGFIIAGLIYFICCISHTLEYKD